MYYMYFYQAKSYCYAYDCYKEKYTKNKSQPHTVASDIINIM